MRLFGTSDEGTVGKAIIFAAGECVFCYQSCSGRFTVSLPNFARKSGQHLSSCSASKFGESSGPRLLRADNMCSVVELQIPQFQAQCGHHEFNRGGNGPQASLRKDFLVVLFRDRSASRVGAVVA